MNIPVTPLDPWIAGCLEKEFPSFCKSREGKRIKSRKEIDAAQEVLLSRMILHASSRSPFYREKLKGYENATFSKLPFTYPSDLAGSGDTPRCYFKHLGYIRLSEKTFFHRRRH